MFMCILLVLLILFISVKREGYFPLRCQQFKTESDCLFARPRQGCMWIDNRCYA
jgi:hypothetical protein